MTREERINLKEYYKKLNVSFKSLKRKLDECPIDSEEYTRINAELTALYYELNCILHDMINDRLHIEQLKSLVEKLFLGEDGNCEKSRKM